MTTSAHPSSHPDSLPPRSDDDAGSARTGETVSAEQISSTGRQPIQLELDGIGTLHPLLAEGHVDPRFILSDETCRIGRKHLAEMRRLLTGSVERPAA